MRKTLLVVSMTVLILSTMFVNAYADTGNTDFFDREFERNAWLMNLTDVSASDWYYPYLVTVYGVMNGISDNQFGPNHEMSRAMTVTVLYRISEDKSV